MVEGYNWCKFKNSSGKSSMCVSYRKLNMKTMVEGGNIC